MFCSATAAAIAAWLFTLQPAVDDGTGATDTLFYRQCFNRAIAGAGAALDAGITIDNPRHALFDFKDSVGADQGTHAAADTFIRIEFEGYNIFKIA
jgi:hypothetical protein